MIIFQKTPNEILPFVVDFTNLVGSGVINTATWTLETGITKDSQSATNTAATAVISGGTANTSYNVTCKVNTTTTGYVFERTFAIAVVDKKYN